MRHRDNGGAVSFSGVPENPPDARKTAAPLQRGNIHTTRASGDPTALLQALELALAGVLGLAQHEVVIVVLASCADEEGRRHKRGRGGSELLDLGNRLGERSRVVENVLVEARVNSSATRDRAQLRAGPNRFVRNGCRDLKGTYMGFRAAMVAVLANLSSMGSWADLARFGASTMRATEVDVP
jgi:hypothetical protein